MDRHIFLAPHLDDAVLSCGGLIYQLAQGGAAVQVVTVMAGDLPHDQPRTPFIQEHVDRWQLGSNPAAGRRAEDEASLARLGAAAVHLPHADLLWRTQPDGTPLSLDVADLFGTIHPADPLRDGYALLARWFEPGTTLYAPLGAGGHVDHQIVRNAARDWLYRQRGAALPLALFFYEEYPYSAQDSGAVSLARAALGMATRPVLHRLTADAMQAKIEAIACHVSQISTFWENAAAMHDAVRAYARAVGGTHDAERLWQPVLT